MGLPTTVFILANDQRELYIGYTKDVEFSLHLAQTAGLTSRQLSHGINQLVYVEEAASVLVAIDRVKVIERMSEAHRNGLIEKQNPKWQDLSKVKVPVAAGRSELSDRDDLTHHIQASIDERIRQFKAKHPDAFDDDPGTGGVPALLPVKPRTPVLSGAESEEIPPATSFSE
jgi:predicted GIY-YIG superfamily endonuclease